MVTTDPADVLSTLIQREPVLYAVDVTGCDKREVTEAVSTSRSTVDRSIRELEDAGLVTRSADGYRRTLLGELLLSEYYRFKSQTAELLSAGEVFADLPPKMDIDPAMLDGATIITATQATPHQPVSSLCSLLTDATGVQLLCPAVFPQLIEACTTATEGANRAEIVVTDPVVSALVSTYSETLNALREAGADLQLLETTPPHGFVVADQPTGTKAGLLIVDDSGARALIKNSSPDAVEWVRSRLDHWTTEATAVSSSAAGGESTTAEESTTD
ncbi:hypothetical protein EGH24_07940 [Halonotius terrestris]|uniref:Uncharacterized protein n=1 Tax=Halonotius terrestris TaxID=2487750 RepID=A0A8J8TBL2_9EURY|nr:hypothetical protein [Halonotius terrestris]TQQ81067.1 hypothetical protein EGH24_07940 [Halonotius terrestris]